MEHIVCKEDLTVEQGFSLCTDFFVDLWPEFKKRFEEGSDLYEINYLFFMIICLRNEASAEWNEAIFRVKKISKNDQRHLKLTPDEVFLCTVEFCHIYNNEYRKNLNEILSLLKSMNDHPDQYRKEWNLWKKNLTDAVTNNCLKPFDWWGVLSSGVESEDK